ncbi:hypothetical protein GCM10022249_13230 [Enteractinococcus coprophilus]
MLVYFVLASAAGAVLRYLADLYLPRRGILLVNVIGSAIAGVVTGLGWEQVIDERVALILLGGFAGSLTTYSTVALTTAQQSVERPGKAIMTWLQHVGLSILVCYLGFIAVISLISVTTP